MSASGTIRLLVAVSALGLLAGPPVARAASPAPNARLIQPSDLVYKGAFRLPEGSGGTTWEWSGDALTYYPGGDPNGPADGYPGSLFGVGHDQQEFLSEIAIPAPVVSASKNVADLPTAKTLQPFRDVRGGLFKDYEIYRCGLEYLPRQGKQTSDKLYFCWGQHMEEGVTEASHGWCELDLAHPKTAGPWRIADLPRYVTTDYLFAIPQAWADASTPGMRLVTGRFRDGGQGAQGPSILAIGPWNEGNPPPPDTPLKAVCLLKYSAVSDDPPQHTLKGYHHADEWAGGAWLTAGDAAAVVFVGTKGLGKCWYGFANGVVWPEEGPFPPIPPAPNDDRGWWSTRFEGQMIFYNPDDLAAVAKGRMKPHEPQPYATMALDALLYNVKGPQQKYHVRSCAFDRERGHLFVLEFRADEERCLVHVWKVGK